MRQSFARKPLKILMDEMAGEHRLRRALGPYQLTALGIGCIIGTGIFVLTGVAAHDKTGPALMLSFCVAGLACVFAALCYAEFASMIPVAGSAYTYAYATLGELMAWIIGWDLILEYGVAAATVSHGWSHYFQDFLKSVGVHLPHQLTLSPFDYNPESGLPRPWVDLPAVLIAALTTVVLVVGIRESALLNAIMVVIKLSIVLFVILVGAFYINPENWEPFAPFGMTGVSFFGKPILGEHDANGAPVGMIAGAGVIFFAYIGFDAVSTQAEEARNPKRDVPIGIIASLAICTLLYIAVAAVLTGMVRYDQIDIHAPVSTAFQTAGLPWARKLVALGAFTGMMSVLLVLMLGQARVFLAMARDGLLPPGFFGTIHPRFLTPWKATIVTGFLVASLGGLLPLRLLAELVNIGTLLAFVIVCSAVLVMRITDPRMERPFRVPWVPLVPILGILTCLLLMFSLPAENWLRLLIWLGIGLVIYFCFGRRHSKLARHLAHELSVHGVVPSTSLATDVEDPLNGSDDTPR